MAIMLPSNGILVIVIVELVIDPVSLSHSLPVDNGMGFSPPKGPFFLYSPYP